MVYAIVEVVLGSKPVKSMVATLPSQTETVCKIADKVGNGFTVNDAGTAEVAVPFMLVTTQS